MSTDVSLVAAFAAGVFSFTSPCVLPLVPIFLAHLAGVSAGERSARARGTVLLNAVAYTAGFSVVFVLLGVAFGAASSFTATASLVAANRVWLVRLGGLLLIVIGLNQLGLVRVPFLSRERRAGNPLERTGTVASSFVIGVTFGAGWSPCVGPILGMILTMAISETDMVRATWLLVTYSAGLSIPFLLTAMAFGSAPVMIRSVQRRIRPVMTVGGAVMLGVGAIMVLGIYERLFIEMIAAAPWQPWEPRL
ncbi:MAG: cytochrome c biogenesis protein CcdA [Chloroflexota bacterium]|nr:cytochrome c biogenesis protein CcdA [Chloroflexota bacterium]